MQADTCAYTPNPHVCTHRQAYTHRASHLSMQALDVCGVCIFPHGICWYSFSKPLAAWCVQLHCRFISLPTQQSLISPSGSYTAQHMIALHWWGGGAISERMRGWREGSTSSIAVVGDNNSPKIGEHRRGKKCGYGQDQLDVIQKGVMTNRYQSTPNGLKRTPRHFLEEHFGPDSLTYWLKISVTMFLVTS